MSRRARTVGPTELIAGDVDRNLSHRRGVLFMLGGAASLVTHDALIKFASQSMPPSQLIFVRGLCAFMLLLALALATRVPLHRGAFTNGWVLLRAGLDVISSVAFVIAIAHVQLANALATFMAAPMLLTLGVVLVHRERVSPGRWGAIVGGFAGVLLVLQPVGGAFNAWALLVLVSACATACRDLVTRSVDREIPSLVITLIALTVMVGCSGIWGVAETWPALTLQQFGVLASAAVLMSCGYLLITVALREGDIGVVAPFRYSILIFSAILGYAIWGDVPNFLAWCGMILIVVTGIYLVRSS